MVVDTLFSTPQSRLSIEAASGGSIDIELRPFDIEKYKQRGAPQWGRTAKRRYSDRAKVTDTGTTTRRAVDYETIDDGHGVLGRYKWDPEQLSLGLITHGEAHIEGQEKQGRAQIERTAWKGDSSILLSDEATGWAVGDVIVVTGVHYVGRDLVTGGYLGSEDEIRTITSLHGAEIGLDRPLGFDHDPPRDDLKAYTANLTRNVLIHSSENLELEHLDAEAVGAVASRLGHVMFMHNEDVSVRYAAFDDLSVVPIRTTSSTIFAATAARRFAQPKRPTAACRWPQLGTCLRQGPGADRRCATAEQDEHGSGHEPARTLCRPLAPHWGDGRGPNGLD